MVDVVTVSIPPRLKEGMAMLDQGRAKEARALFEGYLEVQPDSALALSYAGILESEVGGRPQEGLERCVQALKEDTQEALIYLNLAKAYLAVGNRYQCVHTLSMGMKVPSRFHKRLERYMNFIGVRCRPLIGFLDRNHPINDLWGRVTWKFKRHA